MHSTIRRGSDWAALTKRVPVPWRKRRKILRKFQLPMMPRHPHRQMVSRALQRQGSDQSSVREMNSSIGSVLNCYFRATLQLHHVCMWLNNVEPCLKMMERVRAIYTPKLPRLCMNLCFIRILHFLHTTGVDGSSGRSNCPESTRNRGRCSGWQ